MSLFSALVKVTVDIATLPVAVVKDVFTLGNVTGWAYGEDSHTKQKLDEIKKDSED
jgi:hypothetical protein